MVPEGWEKCILGELLTFKNGLNTEKENYGGGIKFVNVMDIFGRDRLFQRTIIGSVKVSDKNLIEYSVKFGDILFNRTSETFDEIALVYLDEAPITFGGFVIRGRPKQEKLDPEFCVYCFKNTKLRKELIRRGQGAIRANIGQKDLAKVPISYPPIAEQKKIAKILATWDKAITSTEQLLDNSQQQKKVLIQQLLTGKKRFPGFGGKWKKTKLGKLAVKVGSGVTPKGGSNVYLTQGVPLIRSQNVTWGNLDLSDVVFISEEINQKMSGSAVEPNDVLLNITGASIGRSCVAPSGLTEANVNQHVCIIRTKDTLEPHFLCHYLLSFFGQKQIDQFQAGGNRQGLNFEQIKSFNIPVPPIEEQQTIANVLATVDREIDISQQRLDHLKIEKKSLMQQLLTGKRRV